MMACRLLVSRMRLLRRGPKTGAARHGHKDERRRCILEVTMSVLGIASTALSQLGNIQSKFQHVQGEFKTLGQDLKAGNLVQAQTDFVTLSQSVTSQLTSNNPVAKA